MSFFCASPISETVPSKSMSSAFANEHEHLSVSPSGVDSFEDDPPRGIQRHHTEPSISSYNGKNYPSSHERRIQTGLESPKRSLSRAFGSRQPNLLRWISKGRRAKAESLESDRNRQSTIQSEQSMSFEQTRPWDQKAILSLDGGGIRGYSSLLITRALMRKIKDVEQSYPAGDKGWEGPADSSYYPIDPVQATSTDSASVSEVSDVSSKATELSQFLPCHYFDYMAGTSTGGLIAIMLGRLRMNIDDCIEEYETLGAKVFGKSRFFHVRSIPLWFPREKYNYRTLEEVIQSLVDRRIPKIGTFPGGKTFAFDENRCRVVVVAYQQKSGSEAGAERPYLFRTYKNLKRRQHSLGGTPLGCNPGPAHDIPILEVARATSAAPGYFKEVIIDGLKYIDGGFGVNNPCLQIFLEVLGLNNQNKNCIGCVMSVGTGKNVDQRFLSKTGVGNAFTGRLGQFLHYKVFAQNMATDPETAHENMKHHWQRDKKSWMYLRLNFENGHGRMKLDEWNCRSPFKIALGRCIGKTKSWISRARSTKSSKCRDDEKDHTLAENLTSPSKKGSVEHDFIPPSLRPQNKTLETLRAQTEAYLLRSEVQAELQNFATYLVANRRARVRADSERWQRACFGTWYQCQVEDCQRAEYEYPDENSMKQHLRHKHADLLAAEADGRSLARMVRDFRVTVH